MYLYGYVYLKYESTYWLSEFWNFSLYIMSWVLTRPEKLSNQPMTDNVQASICNPKSNFELLLIDLRLKCLPVFGPSVGEEEEDLYKE